MNQGWENFDTNANVFILTSSWSSCLLRSMHAALLVIPRVHNIYYVLLVILSYLSIIILMPVCTYAHAFTCALCNWYKHKSATPFSGSHRIRANIDNVCVYYLWCKHSEGHVMSHHSMCIDWFPCVLVQWNIHSLLTQLLARGYHIYKDGWDTPISLLWTRNWKP